MTRAHEAGTTVGRGRRIDSSFGSPAGRASRDGNEGLRGDGRPPVGTPIRTIHSSVEKEVILRPPQLSVQRPATSLDMTAGNNLGSDKLIPSFEPLRKPRSLENLAPPKSAENEISHVRARLRSVKRPTTSHPTSTEGRNVEFDTTGHKTKPSQDSLDGRDILNELNGLLIGALERAKTDESDGLAENAENPTKISSTDQSTTPQPSLRHQSKERASSAPSQSRLHSTSSHRRSTTEESFKPNSNTNADPVDYIEMPADHAPAEPPSKEQEDHLPVPTSLRKGPSPVKARAALFERMHYHVPGEYIHDRHNREDITKSSNVRSIRKKLETKNAAPRLVHTPPIELALPQLISHRRRHSQRSSGSDHSESCQYDTAKQSIAMSPSATQRKHDRKVSIPWPFKWNLFPQDKATPAPPKSSGVEAKAETGHDEHLTDSSMEHITNHLYVSPAKSALSPTREPSQKRPVSRDATGKGAMEGVSSIQERSKAFIEERTSKTAVPQELQELRSEADPEQPRTPKKRTDLISTQLMTPTKSATPRLKPSTATPSPHTPFRGRTRSGRRDSFVVEQRYSLSRSRSRGGFKILVEVKSADPSPERANDDTVIIIRANVEPLEE
jgi:hypothetical protein